MTDWFALLGINLVLCAGLLAALRSMRTVRSHSAWAKGTTAILFALLWLPMGAAQIPAAAFVRGISSDLSITLVVLAVWSLSNKFGYSKPMYNQEFKTLMVVVVAAAALILYPTSLGWGDWDAYRLGWGSWGMLGMLVALCSVCWVNGLRVLPALVGLALLAWSLGLMESGNLWDYLLDPWLSLYSLGFVFKKCVQLVKGLAVNI